jgi:hypothetical protein
MKKISAVLILLAWAGMTFVMPDHTEKGSGLEGCHSLRLTLRIL